MNPLVVVENTKRFPLRIPGVRVVSARDYLLNPDFSDRRRVAVFNLCRNYGYQTVGYYVSLLAAARGHRPLPAVETVQELGTPQLTRSLPIGLDELIQQSLRFLRTRRFVLSVYFGRNLARRYDRLSNALFNQFPVPLLRARFVKNEKWTLEGLRPIATSDIPESHREFVIERATAYLGRPRRPRAAPRRFRYDMAILVNPEEDEPPSDDRAIRRFVRAARIDGIDATVICPDDYGRLAEFDALFIRETTSVDHHTFRFASRAAAEGLVVIDDPTSIIRCSNKVYLAELFARHRIPTPRTFVIDAEDVDLIEQKVGLPCVLKRADSSFSQGVVRAESRDELQARLHEVLADSELAVAQEWIPSRFDWRIGVLGRSPLYVCRYFMARGHWQIVDSGAGGKRRYGRVEAVGMEEAPEPVVDLATQSASLIGDGLYGVDLKQVDGRLVVMEVNDNPSIDAGYEDALLGVELYQAVMRWFRERLDVRGRRE